MRVAFEERSVRGRRGVRSMYAAPTELCSLSVGEEGIGIRVGGW